MNDIKVSPNDCSIKVDVSEDNSERCIRKRWTFETNLLERPTETIYADSDDFAVFVYRGSAYDGLNRRLTADGAPTAADYVAISGQPADAPFIRIDLINSVPINEGGDDYNYYVAYQYRRTVLQTTGVCTDPLDGFNLLPGS